MSQNCLYTVKFLFLLLTTQAHLYAKSVVVPSKLLATQEIAELILRVATDESSNGLVVLWWWEDASFSGGPGLP